MAQAARRKAVETFAGGIRQFPTKRTEPDHNQGFIAPWVLV
jgi:hypothetical protein